MLGPLELERNGRLAFAGGGPAVGATPRPPAAAPVTTPSLGGNTGKSAAGKSAAGKSAAGKSAAGKSAAVGAAARAPPQRGQR